MLDWTPSERERLDAYLEKARLVANARRALPGVPAVINIGNGGDRRRKRRAAWAVSAGGEPTDGGKLRVACAGPEVVEVSRRDVQPIQVRRVPPPGACVSRS